ncbi:lasso peptide [Nostocales cyanobacterium LEGE 11386]|nr:lasso peptide [Nostocales cyanobacterium LEGE 11386]
MKKQYSRPTLKTHGNVEEITQFLGASSQNDFLFFAGSNSPISAPGSNPITGGGSIDGVITPPSNIVAPRGTLQGN